jgi:alkylation response protein AidB-like acyl-CoA dehydrogenase
MTVTTEILSEKMLRQFHERAPGYDRENRFFSEDFEDLRESGYLNIAVPIELGGLGKNLAEYGREVRRLAYYAPATALATNMHVYWTGIAADLWRAGDDSMEWLLKESVSGEVFAAGHAESGNDLPLLLSTTKAERVDGGYRFYGRKAFGSLGPVWTRLGIHGMDASDPQNPMIVHAFLDRDADNFTIKETWDVLGMRATRSDDTVLEGAFVPDARITRVIPAGVKGADYFIVSLFAWALIGFANIYLGLAQRVRDVVVDMVKSKGSIGLTRPMSYHPEIQHGIAEIQLLLEGMEPHVEAIGQQWSDGVDHGPAWPAKVIAAKYNAVEGAWKIADRALDLSGGFGMFKKSELERLFRDARAGKFHPANPMLSREFVAKTTLGIDPDESPRWG